MDAGEDWTVQGKQKRPVGRPRNDKPDVMPPGALEKFLKILLMLVGCCLIEPFFYFMLLPFVQTT
eukprot:556737-Amphidinium_carterae.1